VAIPAHGPGGVLSDNTEYRARPGHPGAMPSVLPAPHDYEALAPRPGSPVWRAFNDMRLLSTSGYATLLQVAYPTVGYGVHEYSSFLKDPWGRLLRTLDYVHGTIYGGPQLAGELGARVRGMHKTIRGTTPDGKRYNAMEPEAFAWVHATLALAIVEGHRHFAREMTDAEKQAFLDEWLRVGRFIGVREQDLPTRWPDFEAYCERMITEKLQWTPAVPEVLATFRGRKPPNIPGLPRGLWRLIQAPLSLQLRLNTFGLLPPVLRERLELPFSRTDALMFRALGAVSRASGPLIRGPLANFGPRYVRWRRPALARGDVAGGSAARREPAATAA
jgi:uncharacterized protein (DUF2236 family)